WGESTGVHRGVRRRRLEGEGIAHNLLAELGHDALQGPKVRVEFSDHLEGPHRHLQGWNARRGHLRREAPQADIPHAHPEGCRQRPHVFQVHPEGGLALGHDHLLHLTGLADQLERQNANLQFLIDNRGSIGMRDEPLEGRFLPAPERSRIAPTGGGGRADLAIEDPRLSDRVQKFPESVIREMTRIAALHDAINLSQGYPDFDPPRELTDAAKRALDAGY